MSTLMQMHFKITFTFPKFYRSLSGHFLRLKGENSCLAQLQTRLMRAASLNQNPESLHRKAKTMNSKMLKCSVELWETAELAVILTC